MKPLVETLSDPEAELTVFAPTDAAFTAVANALGEEAFNAVLEDQELLTNILLYHVVEGIALAEDVVGLDGESVETLYEDYAVDISLDEDAVFVNEAQVIVTDIEAANGVIHVIDAVLVPTEENMIPSIADVVVAASADEEAPEFTTLLAAGSCC